MTLIFMIMNHFLDSYFIKNKVKISKFCVFQYFSNGNICIYDNYEMLNPVEFNLIKTDTLISDIKIGYINDSFILKNTGININKQKDIESLYKYLNKENQLFYEKYFLKINKDNFVT